MTFFKKADDEFLNLNCFLLKNYLVVDLFPGKVSDHWMMQTLLCLATLEGRESNPSSGSSSPTSAEMQPLGHVKELFPSLG